MKAHKKDVDRASIRENLERSVEDRILNLEALQRFAALLRRGAEGAVATAPPDRSPDPAGAPPPARDE